MRGPIEFRIAALRGQVRRLLALHGLSRLAFGLIAAVLAAGSADWLVHLNPEVRLALLVGVIGLGLYLAVRRVVLPLVVRFADLDIALRIEGRWPGLNDRLASTVQFLRQTRDDGYGSQALRDATVEQTLAQVESIDFRQAADPRAARKAAAWAFAMLAFGAAMTYAQPDLTGIALRRLFRPYGPDKWPQVTHLTVLDETPRKLARGMPFTLAVAVGKGERMPSSARVTYRFPDGETATEPLRPTDDGTFRGRVDAVSRPFTFRVEAGDDLTDPIGVDVVPPPALEKTAVRMIAPEYTGIGPIELAAGNTQVRAVEGTRIEFEARANKPIASAVLRRGDAVAKEAVAIDPTGRVLAASFAVKESQPFWLELVDADGFPNQEIVRFDVRAIRDEAPRVSIDDPSHDRDVPSGATIPIAIAVDDDFGIQLVRLVYKIAAGNSEPVRDGVIPLWAPPEPSVVGAPKAAPIRRQEVRYRWDLAPLKELAPGTVISFHAEARDFDNLKGPNIGKSREMRLRIVSKEEVERQLEDKQRAIREEIERAQAIQKQAKTPVDDALRALLQTDKLSDPAKDQVKNAEIIQRQVGNRLTNRADGLERKIRDYQQDAKDFNAGKPDADRQMAELLDAVNRIKDRNLAPAEQALARAAKQLDRPADPKGEDAANPPDGAKPEGQPEPGADPKGAAPKAEATEGQQAKSQQSKGQQAKGEPSQGQPEGQQPPGDQPEGQPPEAGAAEKGQPSPAGAAKAQPKAGNPPQSKAGKPSPAPRAALAEAEKNQKAIADELEKMRAGLGQFDTIRTVSKEAGALLKEQEELMKQAAEAAAKLAGKSKDNLTPEQNADNANLAAKQNELASRLSKLEAKMDEMARNLDPTDPMAASALREAVSRSRKQATSSKMDEAADNLKQNQMGEAQAAQAQARRDLKDMLDAIQNRRERELSRLVAELKAAEADLKKLQDKQAANLAKTRQAQAEADLKKRADTLKQLAKEQQKLQDEARKQIGKLAKLNAEAGARAGQRAAESMAKAQEGMDQDQGEQAEGDEEDALENLKQAQEEVTEVRKEAEEQLAMEQIAKMGDALKSIAERQDKVVEETVAYEKAKADGGGRLADGQRASVKALGRVEAGLRDESAELLAKLGDGAPVFTLTLKRISDSMEAASKRLAALKTDEPTVQAEKVASGRLKQLVDSLKPDKPKGGGGQQQGGEGQQGGGGQGGGGDGIPASAQIKVLKSLQQELNEKTDFFDELLRRQKELNPEQAAELDKLHADQGALADLVRDLTRPKKDDGED